MDRERQPKLHKTAIEDSVKMSETKSSWSDLPPEILGLFLERLHCIDQVRFRAVCKSWRVPNDYVKFPDHLAWAVNLENYPSSIQLFDPHSQEFYKVVTNNSIDKLPDYISPENNYFFRIYASKNGWLLLSIGQFLLLNPFSNETIILPRLMTSRFLSKDEALGFIVATFTTDPKSPDSEVLVFYGSRSGCDDDGVLYSLSVDRCCVSSNSTTTTTTSSWSSQLLENKVHELFSVHYLDGKVYCLFYGATLKCYDLAAKSWTELKADLPEPYNEESDDSECGVYTWIRYWLTGRGKDLIMVCKCTDHNNGIDRECYVDYFTVFRYDWGKMSWDLSAGLDETALFVRKKVVLSLSSSSQLKVGCRLFCMDVHCEDRYFCFRRNNGDDEDGLKDWKEEEAEEYSRMQMLWRPGTGRRWSCYDEISYIQAPPLYSGN